MVDASTRTLTLAEFMPALLSSPHSASSTIVREFFQLRWHSSSREKIIFTARSAKELDNPQSFLRQIGNVLDTINCQQMNRHETLKHPPSKLVLS
jgi:hypothetical protein